MKPTQSSSEFSSTSRSWFVMRSSKCVSSRRSGPASKTAALDWKKSKTSWMLSTICSAKAVRQSLRSVAAKSRQWRSCAAANSSIAQGSANGSPPGRVSLAMSPPVKADSRDGGAARFRGDDADDDVQPLAFSAARSNACRGSGTSMNRCFAMTFSHVARSHTKVSSTSWDAEKWDAATTRRRSA